MQNADDGSCARCGPNNLLCSKLLCGYCGPGLRLVALIWRIRQRRPIAKLQEDLNRSRHHRRLHQNQIITLVTHSAHSNMLSAHFNVAVNGEILYCQRQALLGSMFQIRETDQKETMPFTHSYRWDPFSDSFGKQSEFNTKKSVWEQSKIFAALTR